MCSRELLMKLRRLLTWYFAVCVGVRKHSRKQCEFLLRRQSLGKQISTICIHLPGIIYIHDHPTKNPARRVSIFFERPAPFHSTYACGGICPGMDPVYTDRIRPIHLGYLGYFQKELLTWRPNPTRWFAVAIEHPLLPPHEPCSGRHDLIERLFASQVCSNIARMYSLASSSKCPA